VTTLKQRIGPVDHPGEAGPRRRGTMLEPAIHMPGTDGNPGGDPARYLAPVGDELDVVDLPVDGDIPPELDGSYVRNGPNSQYPPIGGGTFPFDGDGMIHVITFQQARARYRNKWVVTKDLAAEREAGHALFGGTYASGRSLVNSADRERGTKKNWSNTNVIAHAGRILSLWDGGAPYELSWRFGTVGEHRFDGSLVGAMNAHPKLDPIWDELCFFTTSPEPPYLTYSVVSPRGQVSRSLPVDLPRPVFMHDFAVTDQHVVFFDSPAVIDPAGGADGGPAVRWQPEHGTRVGLLTRDGDSDRVRWFPMENRFAMHFVNAYTDGDEVIVDYIHRDSFNLETAAGIQQSPTLHRCVIETGHGVVRDEEFDPTPVELPCIDDRRAGLHHRYTFLAAVTQSDGRPNGVGFDTLVRYDLKAEDVLQHRFPNGVLVGEPQFVPRRDSLAEGDGWILALTYDISKDESQLVVIDAQDFAAAPRAVVHLPRRVPAGQHGAWLPARDPDAPHRSRSHH
jgi:carotenoid cleavage dioxygenase-like enzyme